MNVQRPMRSSLNLHIEVTHETNLPFDAQGLADEVARLLTHRLAGDPLASATAKLNGAVIARRNDWFDRVYAGQGAEVKERAGRFDRTGKAIRAWYDDGDRMVRVLVNTWDSDDKYEVIDFAGNWEEIR